MPRGVAKFNPAERCPSCDALFQYFPKGLSGKCTSCEQEEKSETATGIRGYIGNWIAEAGHYVTAGCYVVENRNYKSEWASNCEVCDAPIKTKGATRCKRCAANARWGN